MSDSLWPHGLQHARLSCLHYLLEFAQTHVHWVNDTIQPPYLLTPPSPPALNLSPNSPTDFALLFMLMFKHIKKNRLIQLSFKLSFFLGYLNNPQPFFLQIKDAIFPFCRVDVEQRLCLMPWTHFLSCHL